MKLVLIRHGESEWNLENKFTGWKDVDLTSKGVEEAKAGGKALKEMGLVFDIAYTSYLKRAIKTLNYVLEELDELYIPVYKSWRLNERHYGALQGLNKAETAKKYGDEQVLIWRRSFDVAPPAIDKSSEYYPKSDRRYADLSDSEAPLGESLKDTIERVLPYWHSHISKSLQEGKNVIVAAHGNSLRALMGMQYIKVEHTGEKNIVKTDHRGLMLDFSAIAKGYGSDAVAAVMRRHDIKNYMIEIGGEIVTSGISEKRLPWKIGVTKPTDDSLNTNQNLQTVLNVTDRAMATSGNYRNFYYKNGKKLAHTIDPRTGYPVQHSLLSATVLAHSCAEADGYATAFMVLGIEKSKAVLDKHPELMAYFIYADKDGKTKVWYSPSLEKTLVK